MTFIAVLLADYTFEFEKLKMFNSSEERDTWVKEANEDENHEGGVWKIVYENGTIIED